MAQLGASVGRRARISALFAKRSVVIRTRGPRENERTKDHGCTPSEADARARQDLGRDQLRRVSSGASLFTHSSIRRDCIRIFLFFPFSYVFDDTDEDDSHEDEVTVAVSPPRRRQRTKSGRWKKAAGVGDDHPLRCSNKVIGGRKLRRIENGMLGRFSIALLYLCSFECGEVTLFGRVDMLTCVDDNREPIGSC